MVFKLIIDVFIFVNNINMVDMYNNFMLNFGYVVKGENGILGRRYFVKYVKDKINYLVYLYFYEKEDLKGL